MFCGAHAYLALLMGLRLVPLAVGGLLSLPVLAHLAALATWQRAVTTESASAYRARYRALLATSMLGLVWLASF